MKVLGHGIRLFIMGREAHKSAGVWTLMASLPELKADVGSEASANEYWGFTKTGS